MRLPVGSASSFAWLVLLQLAALPIPRLASALSPAAFESVASDLRGVAAGKEAFGPFVGACQFLYGRWAASIAGTGRAHRLEGRRRELLAAEFGDELIDRVEMRYGASMQYFGLGPLQLGGIRADAQTYGTRIYLAASYDAEDDAQTALIAHELVHVRQFLEGSFTRRYCTALWNGHLDYWQNALEREAFSFQQEFACRHGFPGCPSSVRDDAQAPAPGGGGEAELTPL